MEDHPEETTQEHAPRPSWSALDSLLILAITALGAVVRLIGLSSPSKLIFDETYYAKDACYFVHPTAKFCGVTSESTAVHPPLGKWLISIGVEFFGYDSFGWRIMAVVAGTASIALLYLLAKELLASTRGAAVSAALLAADPLHFVQSRVAMLDIFVMLFGVAAFAFLALDRRRLLDPATDRVWGRFNRPWRAAAGVAAGAAFASKWSGALIIITLIIVSCAWEISSRRRRRVEHMLDRALVEEGPSIAAYLIVLPLVVYSLTFIGRIDGSLLALPWSEGSWLRALWDRQLFMYDFHSHLTATHSYQSPPWSWLFLKRPVSYFFCSGAECHPVIGDDNYREILATGNPFVWWASLVALLWVAVAWIRRRDFQRPEGLILAGFVFTYVPWLVIARDRPAVFLFYLLPTLPFMFLALGYVAHRVGEAWEGKVAIATFLTVSMALFAFYYPLLAARTIPRDQWLKRIWVFDQCDPAPPVAHTETTTKTVDGEVSTKTSVTTSSENLPPRGWCWI